jgi:hypothetical protein
MHFTIAIPVTTRDPIMAAITGIIMTGIIIAVTDCYYCDMP